MRILVAEDDPLSQRIVAKILEGLGHEVCLSGDGEQAWAAFARDPFPVVITDWMMPNCDGLELTRRIRAKRCKVYPWVILLTAMDFRENYRQTMEQGVDDFLTKPLDRELLEVRLKVAERVHLMSQQVVALSAALPICMHCKAIRSGTDVWRRVEEFFKEQSDIDFSHSFCPDCYYDHSLRPELQRLGTTRRPRDDERIDPSVLDALLDFDRDASPGIFEDMLKGMRDCAGALREDLRVLEQSGLRSEEAGRRLLGFAQRCSDVGAGRLAALLRQAAEAEAHETLVELGGGAAAELDALLPALQDVSRRSTSRTREDGDGSS